MLINIHEAWIGFLLGFLAGAIPGLFFHRSDWLGGYTSWQRRMVRLAHIAFFGLGLINLSFALTARTLGLAAGLGIMSALLIVGAVAMPLVCYLSAWRVLLRQACAGLNCVTTGSSRSSRTTKRRSAPSSPTASRRTDVSSWAWTDTASRFSTTS